MKKIVGLLLFLSFVLPAPAQYITNVNKATLAQVREQQKLSRDVFTALNDKWDQSIFQTLCDAEDQHMEAVKGLLDQFAVSDPVEESSDVQGRFVRERLQQLYDSLVICGFSSLEGAYRAGAYLEERDIHNLQLAVSSTGSPDLKATYKYLMLSAQQHLLSFARKLKRIGVLYHPILLSRMDYDRIVGASGGSGSEKR